MRIYTSYQSDLCIQSSIYQDNVAPSYHDATCCVEGYQDYFYYESWDDDVGDDDLVHILVIEITNPNYSLSSETVSILNTFDCLDSVTYQISFKLRMF